MTTYAYIEDGLIKEIHSGLPQNWRNISNLCALESDYEYLKNLGFRKVTVPVYEYNEQTQYMSEPEFNLVDDEVFETRHIIDVVVPEETTPYHIDPSELKLPSQILAEHTMAIYQLRSIRDQLLRDTDYTQVQDITEINGLELTQQFKEYRQTLRDMITAYDSDETFNDISTVSFPTRPGAK